MNARESRAVATGDDGVACLLILDARSELLFFKSAGHLLAYVEAVDVENGEYGARWDSQGRQFALVVETARERILGVLPVATQHVVIRPESPLETHVGDLHLALLRHIEAVGLTAAMPSSNETLELLTFALEHSRWS